MGNEIAIAALIVSALFGWLRQRDKLKYDQGLTRLASEHKACQETLTAFRDRLDAVMAFLGLRVED